MNITEIEAIMKLMDKYRIEEVEVEGMKFVKKSHLAKPEEATEKKSFRQFTEEELLAATPGYAKGPTDFDKFKATQYLKEYNKDQS